MSKLAGSTLVLACFLSGRPSMNFVQVNRALEEMTKTSGTGARESTRGCPVPAKDGKCPIECARLKGSQCMGLEPNTLYCNKGAIDTKFSDLAEPTVSFDFDGTIEQTDKLAHEVFDRAIPLYLEQEITGNGSDCTMARRKTPLDQVGKQRKAQLDKIVFEGETDRAHKLWRAALTKLEWARKYGALWVGGVEDDLKGCYMKNAFDAFAAELGKDGDKNDGEKKIKETYFGGDTRVTMINDFAAKMENRLFVLSTSWEPVPSQTWKEYLQYVTGKYFPETIGKHAENIITTVDPGTGYSGPKKDIFDVLRPNKAAKNIHVDNSQKYAGQFLEQDECGLYVDNGVTEATIKQLTE